MTLSYFDHRHQLQKQQYPIYDSSMLNVKVQMSKRWCLFIGNKISIRKGQFIFRRLLKLEMVVIENFGNGF